MCTCCSCGGGGGWLLHATDRVTKTSPRTARCTPLSVSCLTWVPWWAHRPPPRPQQWRCCSRHTCLRQQQQPPRPPSRRTLLRLAAAAASTRSGRGGARPRRRTAIAAGLPVPARQTTRGRCQSPPGAAAAAGVLRAACASVRLPCTRCGGERGFVAAWRAAHRACGEERRSSPAALLALVGLFGCCVWRDGGVWGGFIEAHLVCQLNPHPLARPPPRAAKSPAAPPPRPLSSQQGLTV